VNPSLGTADKITVIGMASYNFFMEEEVLRLPLELENHGHHFLGCRRVDFGRHCAVWSNH